MSLEILKDRTYISPEAQHAIKRNLARKAEGFTSRGPLQVTMFEANWKFQEICDRFRICLSRKTVKDCFPSHYNEAKSIIGTIRKNKRVTLKQWSKLVTISFMLFEISDPEGQHYCKFY